MKYCAKCRNSFSDTLQICPNDSSLLIEQHDSKVHTLEHYPDFNPDFNPDFMIGQLIDGKYKVESLLGTGGMGAVFRARHTFINNEVAIKFINPKLAASNDIAERFLREARAAAMIDHPNAIKVNDFGRAEGMLYLVMEFIHGYSLTHLIREEEHLSPATTVDIMHQICAALDAAHSHNIIHRDLKPDNIMIKQIELGQLVVKVLDFGLAKIKTAGNDSLTGAGMIIGTLSYMSPEQCSGDNVIDFRTDIYSLGIIAFQMLTGKLPFMASTFAGFLSKHIFEQPPSLRSIRPEIPEAVEKVVLRAMEKEPSARYQSAGAFAADLTRAVRSSHPDNTEKNTPNLLTVPYSHEPSKEAKGKPPSAETVLYNKSDRERTNTMTSGGSTRLGHAGEQVQTGQTGGREFSQAGESGANIRSRSGRKLLYAGIAVGVLLAFSAGLYIASLRDQNGPAPPGSQKKVESPQGMVLLQGGLLKMGSAEGYDYEQPIHDVLIDSFYIDEAEVTNAQFRKFVEATGHKTDAEKVMARLDWQTYATPDRDDHPVVLVSWNDAVAYAKWAGKRLPTEAEWEYAARGGLIGKKYPWGDEPPARKANFDRGRKTDILPTEPAGSYEPNGYGLYNMAGNVAEWCQDWYESDYYKKSPPRNPTGPSSGQSRVIRGGSWYTDFNQLRNSARISESPEGYEFDRGFRCAKSVAGDR